MVKLYFIGATRILSFFLFIFLSPVLSVSPKLYALETKRTFPHGKSQKEEGPSPFCLLQLIPSHLVLFLPILRPLFSAFQLRRRSRRRSCFTMRSITSCYNEHAIRISDSHCSGPSNQAYLCPKQSPSVRDSIACTYRVDLSPQKQLLITLNWTKKLMGQGFDIAISNTTPTSNSNSRQLGKSKGNETFQVHDFKIQVRWDLSDAKYESGPEPASGFYVVVLVDSELGLRLGDKGEESWEEVKAGKSSMVYRRERFCGSYIYATKAHFCETGMVHEILIKWVVEEEGSKTKGHVLCVNIDKKTILEVKRLRWNFRGNQAIFLEGGLMVDVMWDVHDWLFKPSNRRAVFMFRRRSGMDSRLWLEDKTLGPHRTGFSLLLCAFNNPN